MPDFAPLVLTTPRLRLRPPHTEDAAALLAIYADAEVARYLSRPAWTDIAQAHAWLERVMQQNAEASAVQWLLQRDDDGVVVGTAALFNLHRESRRAEVGYTLGREHWHRGYAGEAVAGLLDHAFGALDLRRIEADIDPRNAASARVLERLGFVKEGRLRERWEVAGEISDSVLYGLLRREWRVPG